MVTVAFAGRFTVTLASAHPAVAQVAPVFAKLRIATEDPLTEINESLCVHIGAAVAEAECAGAAAGTVEVTVSPT